MDKTKIYSKTAKGMGEVSGGGKNLVREHYRVLSMIDGRSSIGDLLAATAVPPERFIATLDALAAAGLVRVFSSGHADNTLEWKAAGADDDFPDVLPVPEVQEFTPQESVQAWAQARRGAAELKQAGFYSYGNKGVLAPAAGEAALGALVIEDDEEIAALLVMLLSEKGFKVQVVGDMRDAMALVQNGKSPDVVLLDVVLPGMPGKDGFDLLAAMRRERAWSRARVVMVTSQVSDDQVMKGLRADADAYIFKPFKWETLYACIKSVVGI